MYLIEALETSDKQAFKKRLKEIKAKYRYQKILIVKKTYYTQNDIKHYRACVYKKERKIK